MQNEEPTALPTSSLAVASLVAAILGISFVPFIGSVVALITGLMARKEIAGNADAIGGDGIALAGVILGLIGIVLGVILCCLLLVPMVLTPILLIPVFREMGMLCVLGI